MTAILVDSNVLLDLLTEDERWFAWSAATLAHAAESATLVINPLIYAEVAVGFARIETMDEALPPSLLRRDPLPYEAGFLAAQCFATYRRRGGARSSPLPDFYIGAHAAVAGMSLMTRDVSRFATYFPTVKLIAP
ncbi:MAG: type II toxin-antitoxin system VapC family toxin [Myxococcota bacterium]